MHDFVEDLTESYSHGMKQRLAFAAAMLHDPKVLVIDEPMVGLDPRSVRLVKDLSRAKAAAGQTIFMSTHLLSIAEEIADRVGIVDQGRLRFWAPSTSLRQELATHETSLEQLYLSFTAEHRHRVIRTSFRHVVPPARSAARKPRHDRRRSSNQHASPPPHGAASPVAQLSPGDEAGMLRRLRMAKSAEPRCGRRCRARIARHVGGPIEHVFWYGLFRLFGEGFEFLSTTIGHPVTHALTVQAIYKYFSLH